MPQAGSERGQLIRSIRRSPIASIVTDAQAFDNPIIAANSHFETLTGYSEQELIGRNCRILAGEETDPARSALLRKAVASATPQVVTLINYRKDGSRFLNAVMVAPVFDNAGHLAHFVGSQMEVTGDEDERSRKTAAEQIRKLTGQQQNVLSLMARGWRNKQIGVELGLAEKTIKMHRSALVRRLGLSTAAEAIRLAIQAGF